jgi:hypothetical protein
MTRLDQMPMTPLRRRFIDDMLLRNYSLRTIETYVTGVVRVARHFRRSPDLLGQLALVSCDPLPAGERVVLSTW